MTKLTQDQKNEIISLINNKKVQLKTVRAVATFCKVSDGTLSMMLRNLYTTEGDDIWVQVGTALGWNPIKGEPGKGWVIVDTTDYKNLSKTLLDAKNHALFIPVSDLAGKGKSTVLKHYADHNQANAVFYVRCLEWNKTEFLENLCRILGIDKGRGYKTTNALISLIIEFFQARTMFRPQLLIDEANKLKPAALRFLIPFYNELEDAASVVIAGTEDLEADIKNGVKYHKKGYDEIDSRFGRNYLKLIGCTMKDVISICHANGIPSEEQAKVIFKTCDPINKDLTIQNKKVTIQVVTDLRKLKRQIKKELLTSVYNN